MKKYWFKLKKFLGIFAAYYPVSREDWTVTAVGIIALVLTFYHADSNSHSVSDTFYSFAPAFIVVLLIFDLVCFRTGEYPSWWKKNEKSQD